MSHTSQQQILVVEDDPDIAETLDAALQELGYAVSVAASGEQGWALLSDGTGPPALVLLDFLLSGEDGMDLCRTIKSHPEYRHIPVILMSAHPGARDRAPQANADDFLPKPFDLEQLEQVIARYVPVVR